jgi:acyl CoA:acetate/3-ketoacid CoA transferase alpha subunit/acyl CoA:acetate/3-ketoacid CoA transferase beta subunit
MRKLVEYPVITEKVRQSSDKIMPLDEAVKASIRPGMLIHTGQTNIRWCSAIYYEIARQFWGCKADLTLVGISLNFPQAVLVHGGIVRKIITSYCGDPYYAPSPNRVYQRAFKEGKLEIQNWSIYTVCLRLQAAAMGLPFLPTHSIMGSSMEQENVGDFCTWEDPFGSGQQVGLVKALQPDLTVIHAWIADTEGNAVFLPPLGENLYGAMASKEGVLLTVEKIVPTETILEYSHLTKLPGIYVKSISEVPFGAHPSGLSRSGMDMDLYGEDYDFIEQAHQAAKNPESFQHWIDTWILSCRTHEDYLRKVSYDRLLQLKGQSHFDSWMFDLEAVEEIDSTQHFTVIEMAIVAMGRKLMEKVKATGCKTLLAGAGIANLAAWLCFYLLKEQGHGLELMAEIGLYGYVPRPADPALFNQRNFPTCKMTTDIHTIIGLLVGGEKAAALGALGAAQVDVYGNVNTTKTSADEYLIGSGGANDVASRARDIVVIAPQSKERFPEKLHYITSPGKNVGAVVSTMGVFEKCGGGASLVLTGIFPQKGKTEEQTISEIRKNCGWSFEVAARLDTLAAPTRQELDLIRLFDPRRYYLGPKPQ